MPTTTETQKEETSGPTPGLWEQGTYGAHSFEIQGGGRSLAVVNGIAERVNADTRERNAAAKARGEPQRQLRHDGRGEALANARLMAAAPELLAACVAGLASVTTSPLSATREAAEKRSAAIEQVRAAIAKAGAR